MSINKLDEEIKNTFLIKIRSKLKSTPDLFNIKLEEIKFGTKNR